MNKADLAARVATEALLSKADADDAVRAVFSTIADALAHGKTIRIAGFGTFSIKWSLIDTNVVSETRTPTAIGHKRDFSG